MTQGATEPVTQNESIAPEWDVIAHHAPDALLALSRDGRILAANDTALVMYGRSRADLIGRSVIDLGVPGSRIIDARLIGAVDPRGITFETTHMRSDGSLFTAELSCALTSEHSDAPMVCAVRDISSRNDRDARRDDLLTELEAANHELEGLLRIVSAAVGRLDLDRLFSEVLATLADVMATNMTLLFLAEDGGLRLAASSGEAVVASELDHDGEFVLAPDEGFAGAVARAGEPYWVLDVRSSAMALPVHERRKFVSMLGVPLYLDGELYGVLECAWGAERLVSDAERVMLQVAADRIMSAVAGARSHQRTLRSKSFDSALAEASGLLALSLDLTETMPRALETCRAALGCDVVAFGRIEGDTYEIISAAGMTPCCVPAPQTAHAADGVGLELPVLVIDSTREDASRWLRAELGLSRATLVPVPGVTEWYGAILFGAADDSGQTDDDPAREFMCEMAKALSHALHNAHEYESAHRIAETLQEALLNVDKGSHGVVYGELYRSATTAARVGGDFYDIFPLADHRVAVVVGDVSGKGLEAAVLTMVIKQTVRAFAYEATAPSEVVARTNDVLLATTRLPEFASMIVGFLDVDSGRFDYCCAGHPPALLRRGDQVVELSCESPVIGVAPQLNYVDSTIDIGPDDLLVCYTDGVTEARDDDGHFFGDERLADALSQTRGLDADTVPAAIFDAVMAFTQGHLSDDVALLALRRS